MSISTSERNFSLNSISASSSPSLYALLPSPSLVHLVNSSKFNLSTQPQWPFSSSPLPTDFYLLFKDGYQDIRPSELNKQVNVSNIGEHTANDQNTAIVGKSQPTFLRTTQNFWSDILTTSLSPRVETLMEYVLIGMLAFVLLQIGIAYLLASEIRTLRSELAMLASMTFHKKSVDHEEEEVVTNFQQTNLIQCDKELTDFCELQCFESAQTSMPLTASENNSNCLTNLSSDFCLFTFQPSLPLVQVHANSDSKPTVALEPVNSINSNYVNVIIDEALAKRSSKFSSSTSTAKTNRRNQLGSFRVTFDSAPEYIESKPKSSFDETLLQSAIDEQQNQFQQKSEE